MSVRILRPSALLRAQPARCCFFPTTTAPAAFHRAFSDRPETLSAHRTLPYPTLPVYDIITSIESYPDFIPFCTSAHITSFSNPDHFYQRKWPQRAALTIGYGTQINESFVSRVYCVPPIPDKGRAGVGIVEAISGSAKHTLDADAIAHHTVSKEPGNTEDTLAGPLEYLRTRWTVRNYPYKPAPEDGTPAQEGSVQPAPQATQMTDVALTLEYKFSNPLYEIMGKAVAGKIAEKMIEAFVKRVESVLKDDAGVEHKQEKRF